jgi:hypothetical protein
MKRPLALLLLALSLSACGSSETAAPPEHEQHTAAIDPGATPEADTPPTEPATEPPPTEPTPTATTDTAAQPVQAGDPCVRARACCAAYAAALPAAGTERREAQEACAQIDRTVAAAGAASAPACEAAIDGWRTSLEQMRIAVPTDCADAAP